MEANQLPDRPMTATLVRAQAADDDPNVFGCVIAFPDGTKLQAAFKAPAVGYLDPVEIPRQIAESFVSELLKRQNVRALDATNWASVTAALQRMAFDWNREKRARIQHQPAFMQ